jgi:predicted dehydrogenase
MTTANNYHARTQKRLSVHAEKYKVDAIGRWAAFPKEFESVFPDAALAIIGAGDWVFGWSSVDKRLDHLTDGTGRTRYVYAPELVREDGSENRAALDELCRRYRLDPSVFGTIMQSPDHVPDGAIAFIFSPNDRHDDQLEALLRSPKTLAVYVEKPMAINGDELKRVDSLTRQHAKKIYFGDHYLFASIGLFALMGKHMPYKNLLTAHGELSGELSQAVTSGAPVLNNITRIDARAIFVGHENLLNRRGWLEYADQGGGVLLDLQVHLSNLFHALGFQVEEICHVECRVRPSWLNDDIETRLALGLYRQRVKNEELAEDRAFMYGRTTSGATFVFEVAQFAEQKDQANYFQVSDSEGKSLKLYFDHPYKVELLDSQKNVLGKIEQKADAVLLMMHHALSYIHFDEDNEPLFYDEQRASIDFIERIKGWSLPEQPA